MTTEDILRLKTQAEGDADLQRLIARFEQVQRHTKDLNDAFGRGAVHGEVYRRELASLDRQATVLREKLEAVGRGGMLSAHGLMQVGRAAQDFQAAGFMGIANNLEGIALSLGMGAGLAGAATIAGTVLTIFTPQIREFFSELRVSGTERLIETEAAQLRELAKAAELTAEQTERLTKAKREQAEVEALAGRLSPDKLTQKQAVEAAFFDEETGSSAAAVMAGFERTQRDAGRFFDRDEQRNLAKLRGQLARPMPPAKRAELEQQVADIEAGARQRANAQVNSAMTDPLALSNLAAVVESAPQNFPMGLAKGLRDADPQARAEQARIEEEGRRNQKRIEEEMKAEQQRQQEDIQADEAATRKRLQDKAQAEEKAARDAEQGALERQREAEKRDRELDRRAEQVGGPFGSRVEMAMLARDATRERLMGEFRGQGLDARNADRWTNRMMRGQGFASNDEMRQRVANDLLRSGQVQSAEEASQLAGRIVEQAAGRVNDRVSQATEALGSRDQAILATMQDLANAYERMMAGAANTEQQARRIQQQVNGFGNGGIRVPPMLPRNR